MANDRKRSDEQYTGSDRDRGTDMNEERLRGGPLDDVRGIADEGEEEFEDTDDLNEEEDSEGSF
jgi:hypothetical protein